MLLLCNAVLEPLMYYIPYRIILSLSFNICNNLQSMSCFFAILLIILSKWQILKSKLRPAFPLKPILLPQHLPTPILVVNPLKFDGQFIS